MSIERGSLLYQTGRYDQAEREFREALGTEPNDALAHVMIGYCLLKKKSFADATDEAKQAIGLRPDWYLGYAALATIFLERERPKEAATAIGQAIGLNPFDPNLHATMAHVRLKLRNWPGALDAASAGLSVDPEHAGCVNARGIALVQLGRREEAGSTLQGALGRNPLDAMTHANQGWALLHSNDPKAALIHFREALRIDPNLAWAKSGIVEAMKARNFIYRIMLRYFLLMSRLSGKMQWGIIIGAYVGVRMLRAATDAHPGLALFTLPIYAVYIVFALLTWLAMPLFNLMLRLDRFGRYALSRDQRVSSNWIGLLLLAGITLAVTGLIRGDSRLVLAGLYTAVVALPASAVFGCDRGWPRSAMTAYTVAVAATGGFLIAFYFLPTSHEDDQLGQLHQFAQSVFPYGLLLSGFVANGLRSATVRK